MYAPKLCGIVKLLRHIIYDKNKADVEISAPIKNICVHQKIGAQTLTIWARQNLQFCRAHAPTAHNAFYGKARNGKSAK